VFISYSDFKSPTASSNSEVSYALQVALPMLDMSILRIHLNICITADAGYFPTIPCRIGHMAK
jgi:hypothetical protein